MAHARQINRRSPGLTGFSHRLEYRFLVTLSFAICLAMIGGQRALSAIRGATGGDSALSLFAEARSAAHATAGYVFHV